MKLQARHQDDFLIDISSVQPIGESPLDQLLREDRTCLRQFDNKADTFRSPKHLGVSPDTHFLRSG